MTAVKSRPDLATLLRSPTLHLHGPREFQKPYQVEHSRRPLRNTPCDTRFGTTHVNTNVTRKANGGGIQDAVP